MLVSAITMLLPQFMNKFALGVIPLDYPIQEHPSKLSKDISLMFSYLRLSTVQSRTYGANSSRSSHSEK